MRFSKTLVHGLLLDPPLRAPAQNENLLSAGAGVCALQPSCTRRQSSASNSRSNLRKEFFAVPTMYAAAFAQELDIIFACHAAIHHPIRLARP